MTRERKSADPAEQPELFTASDVARFCQVDPKTIHSPRAPDRSMIPGAFVVFILQFIVGSAAW